MKIVQGADGSRKFDIGNIPAGAAPVVSGKIKAPTHRERADGIHAWVNEAAKKGVFDRTNGVQDQEGFTTLLGEFDPSKMKYSDYQGKYQEYLAGHMPGKIAGQSLLNAAFLPTAVHPTDPKVKSGGQVAGSQTPATISTNAPGKSVDFKMGPSTPPISAPKRPGTGTLGEVVRVGEYTYTKTAGNHIFDTIKEGPLKGTMSRPYMNSPLTVQEIQAAGKPIPDPGGIPGALRYDVPGHFRGAQGRWELVVDPKSRTIFHFLFIQ
jgi:hypothetical protein